MSPSREQSQTIPSRGMRNAARIPMSRPSNMLMVYSIYSTFSQTSSYFLRFQTGRVMQEACNL